MANVHGLYTNKKDDSDDEDSRENRYVGGVDSRGGGSGLAVEPIPNNDQGGGTPRDDIFQLAESATNASSDDEAAAGGSRRTITMYRNGFVVDNGPYRRVDDVENADFLRSLAMGRTPRELANEGNVTVNLVDKRSQDYVETFRSFSGAGASLGSSATAAQEGVIDPSTLASPLEEEPFNLNKPTTSIQVKLWNGKKKVVKLNLDSTVGVLASMLVQDAAGESFLLTAGFPPRPLTDMGATIQDCGLEGAQVIMKRA